MRVMNLGALAAHRTPPDNPGRHASVSPRLLPRARARACDRRWRGRAARAAVAQASRAARLPGAQPAPEPHARAPRGLAVERPGRAPGAPFAERGAARVSAHSRRAPRSEEHTSELQSPCNLVCRLLLEKKKKTQTNRLANRSTCYR